ncbi:MAG: glycosyltransferase family 1 protein [Rhodocyclaceae bacterium]|nr:MAG: glycosyltransferase family 1 protein [Rhodocyclaceae bacterium]
MTPRLLFVVNTDWFFVSHRLPIAEAAIRAGYEVHVACTLTGAHKKIEAVGAVVHSLQISRGGRRLLATWHEFKAMADLFKQLRPDIVHLVTIKPVLLGGIAARWAKVPAVVAAISGLGFIFLSTGWKAKLRRVIVGAMYSLALSHPRIRVIFQNPDDRDAVCATVDLPKESIEMIRGSGVDLVRFRQSPLPTDIPKVMMASRLLKDKGVREFVEAASLLKWRGLHADFCLVGDIDPANPSSLTRVEVDALAREGAVEFWGHQGDMAAVLPEATIVVLPSYREGLPKVLLEAAASGRPVVTCDVPGCRDAIAPGQTGLLVPKQDCVRLADAIQTLLENTQLMESMRIAGRKLAEEVFSSEAVAERHLAIYDQLMTRRLGGCACACDAHERYNSRLPL